MAHILCFNPGSTSTKIAYFDDTVELYRANVHHAPDELARFPRVIDQADFRIRIVLGELSGAGVSIQGLDAVVGRGGLTRPIPGGTYAVDERLIADVENSPMGEHASNLGAVMAAKLASFAHVPAFIVDPVMVDELDAAARFSGHPEIQRHSIFHALNSKAVARRYAREHACDYAELNLIVAHLGGGITVSAHRRGRVVDVNNGLNGDGPFAPERAGTLPVPALADLCFSGQYTETQVRKLLAGRGGWVSLLGTNDGRAVARLIAEGDADARLALDAMAYQVAKEIGACAAVLAGDVDAILVTGGLAHDAGLVEAIAARVRFVGPVVAYPGEDEMSALNEGALRVLRGEEEVQSYDRAHVG